jgi:hypothetical protein
MPIEIPSIPLYFTRVLQEWTRAAVHAARLVLPEEAQWLTHREQTAPHLPAHGEACSNTNCRAASRTS